MSPPEPCNERFGPALPEICSKPRCCPSSHRSAPESGFQAPCPELHSPFGPGSRLRPAPLYAHQRGSVFGMRDGFDYLFAPTPASIGVPISSRDAQHPYGLIRLHHICSEPRHFCRPIRVRYVAIPAFRSPELSGAPGVTSGLEDTLLLNSGIPVFGRKWDQPSGGSGFNQGSIGVVAMSPRGPVPTRRKFRWHLPETRCLAFGKR